MSGTLPPESEVAVNQTIKASPAEIVAPSSLGTKWLKFWNYFGLPVGGLLQGISTMSLAVTPEDVPSLGIIMVPLVMLHFIVAYGLHYRRLWAWEWNYGLIVIFFLIRSIPIPTAWSAPTIHLTVLFIIQLLLVGLIWMWPNHIYWKKRRGLFS